jgi:hypothetical protein
MGKFKIYEIGKISILHIFQSYPLYVHWIFLYFFIAGIAVADKLHKEYTISLSRPDFTSSNKAFYIRVN